MITFMQNQWIEIDGDTIVIGINSDAMESLESVTKIFLPDKDDKIGSMRSFGEVEGTEESLSLYSPFEGIVLEVNEALLDTPELLNEDHMEDGWIIKISVAEGEDISESRIEQIQESL